MVKLIVCNTKESRRFPGKNRLLAQITFDWIQEEIKDLKEPVEVYYIQRENSLSVPLKFDNFNLVYCPDESADVHLEVFKWFERTYGATDATYVQLQVTQPNKRKGLLKDILDKVTDDNMVLAYSVWDNEHWRIVDNGTLEFEDERSTSGLSKFYDGSVCAWRGPVEKLFDLKNQRKVWVENSFAPVCDVDHRFHFNSVYLTGLQTLTKQNQNEKF